MKDLGSQILNFHTITNSPRNVGINAVKVLFVQLGKAARVFLSSFDQEPFIGFSCLTQGANSPRSAFPSLKLTRDEIVTVLIVEPVIDLWPGGTLHRFHSIYLSTNTSAL